MSQSGFLGVTFNASAIGGTAGGDFTAFAGVELTDKGFDAGGGVGLALAFTPDIGIGKLSGAELDSDFGVLVATSIDDLNAKNTIQTDFNLVFFSVRVFTGLGGVSEPRGISLAGGGNIGFGIVQEDFSAKLTFRDGLVIGE